MGQGTEELPEFRGGLNRAVGPSKLLQRHIYGMVGSGLVCCPLV